MRISPQILKAQQLGMTVEEIEQEVARGAAIHTVGCGTQRRTDGVNGSREHGGEGVIDGSMAGEVHDGSLGSGRMSWATARAYWR
jgi:hypothetical protein